MAQGDRRFSNWFLYCGLDKQDYLAVRSAIAERNFELLHYSSGMVGVFGLVFTAVSLVSPVGNGWLYAFIAAVGIALWAVIHLAGPFARRHATLLGYVLIAAVLTYAIALSFLPGHTDNPSVSFVVFLAIMPLTVIDAAWHMYLFSTAAAAVFMAGSFMLKPAAAATTDLANVGAFLVVGLFLYTIMSNTSVRELLKTLQIERLQDRIIVSMATVIEERDENTGGHINRTAAYVRGIVERIRNMPAYAERPDSYWDDVVRAAPLHDVGKVHVPDAILNKPGRLTDDEFAVIKMHPRWSADIIAKTLEGTGEDEFLEVAYNMALHHHERYDGAGYPGGLTGEAIPLEARIMALADVYDALVSLRSYKPPFPPEQARAIILEGVGTQFDPRLAAEFISYLDAAAM